MPRPAPYDGFRMVSLGQSFAADWRRITDGSAPRPCMTDLGCFVAEAHDTEVSCCPWPEDPRVTRAAA